MTAQVCLTTMYLLTKKQTLINNLKKSRNRKNKALVAVLSGLCKKMLGELAKKDATVRDYHVFRKGIQKLGYCILRLLVLIRFDRLSSSN